MDLCTYFAILSRRGWAVAVSTLTAMAVTMVGTFVLMTPQYVASATVRVAAPQLGSLDYVSYDTQLADRLVVTYGHLLDSDAYRKLLVDRFGRSPEFTVSILPKSELIRISVQDADPLAAAEAANALSEAFVAHIQELEAQRAASAVSVLRAQLAQAEVELSQAQQDYDHLFADATASSDAISTTRQALESKQRAYDALVDQLNRVQAATALRTTSASIIESASPPAQPSSPRLALNILIGLLVGSIGGVGLAFLFERLDTTLYSTERIRELTGRPILGRIPSGLRLVMARDGQHLDHGPYDTPIFNPSAPFDWLRVTLFPSQPAQGARVVAITSAEPGDGKTTVALGLAVAVARAGHEVLLIDGNLRSPELHQVLGVANDVGFSSVLRRSTSIGHAVQESGLPGMSVLTGGPPVVDATAALNGPTLSNTMALLRSEYDVLILDTPDLHSASDAAELIRQADRALLVVARGRSRAEPLLLAQEHLAAAGVDLMGIVVNYASVPPRGSRRERSQFARHSQAQVQAALTSRQEASAHHSARRRPGATTQGVRPDPGAIPVDQFAQRSINPINEREMRPTEADARA